MTMTSVMAGVQADVPFVDIYNYFENNYIIIVIMLFQSVIMILSLIKNSYPRAKMLKQNINSYFISNVIISVIFSLVTFIFVITTFYVRLSLYNDLSSYKSIYFFGIEVSKFNGITTLKILLYCLSSLLAITALSNMLGLLTKLWTKISLGILTVFFIMSLWKKTFAVTSFSYIFEMNRSSYLITFGIFLVAILIFAVDYRLVQKRFIISNLAEEN